MHIKPKNIENEAQFIYGVGASAWFYISKEGKKYRIKRYSASGELECNKLFHVKDTSFDITKAYKFTYLSHCKRCVVIQAKIKFIFEAER
tara:strand:- start:951 stop:1220 length:270 start_codon:yes stop_codon:yes gene_type:complete